MQVIREEWNNVLNLAATIVDCLDTITADCSLLVVCIMAHGRTGMISGTNNSEIPIDDILQFIQTVSAAKHTIGLLYYVRH